jgi:hypothetical protein
MEFVIRFALALVLLAALALLLAAIALIPVAAIIVVIRMFERFGIQLLLLQIRASLCITRTR